MRLGIVTATADKRRAEPCFASWEQHAAEKSLPVLCVENTYVGVVPAFKLGIERALKRFPECDVIACFHDDLVIFEQGWDTRVLTLFADLPGVGLAGFGGWPAVGRNDLYEAEYDPEQLQGLDYRSNLTDAETWGSRSHMVERVVAVSRFSQIGRRAFWEGFTEAEWRTKLSRRKVYPRPWATLAGDGMVDGFYAEALGCLARRGGWQVMSLPVRCRHLGGATTGDVHYLQWAADEYDGGDRGIREAAHRIGYDTFKDVLPLRL